MPLCSMQVQSDTSPAYVKFELEGSPGYSELLIKKDDAVPLFPHIKNSTLKEWDHRASIVQCGMRKDGDDFAIVINLPEELQNNSELEARHVRQVCSLATSNFNYNFLLANPDDLIPVLKLVEYLDFDFNNKNNESNYAYENIARQRFSEKLYNLAENNGMLALLYGKMYARSSPLWRAVERSIGKDNAVFDKALQTWREKDPHKQLFDRLVSCQLSIQDYLAAENKDKSQIQSLHDLDRKSFSHFLSGCELDFIKKTAIQKTHLPLLQAIDVQSTAISSPYAYRYCEYHYNDMPLTSLEPVDLDSMSRYGHHERRFDFNNCKITTVPTDQLDNISGAHINLRGNPLSQKTIREIQCKSQYQKINGNKVTNKIYERYWLAKAIGVPALIAGASALTFYATYKINDWFHNKITQEFSGHYDSFLNSFMEDEFKPSITPATLPIYQFLLKKSSFAEDTLKKIAPLINPELLANNTQFLMDFASYHSCSNMLISADWNINWLSPWSFAPWWARPLSFLGGLATLGTGFMTIPLVGIMPLVLIGNSISTRIMNRPPDSSSFFEHGTIAYTNPQAQPIADDHE